MTEPEGIDRADIEAFLCFAFEAGDHVELRALRTEGRGGAHNIFFVWDGETISSSVVEWIESHNTPNWDCFVGANPRQGEQGSGKHGGGVDADVALARTVFVDFDDADLREAQRRIASAGVKSPSLLVSSGRATGTHAYWRIREPIQDLQLWRGLQSSLIRSLGSDASIKNPSRIMRLPGTKNHKRSAPCRIVGCKSSEQWFDSWSDLGVEPQFVSASLPIDPNLKPDESNLNNSTLRFLQEKTGEGERNSRLFAAAMDYNANNFPIAEAIHRLAHDLVYKRDGLEYSEAERTVRNAYEREAAPSLTREVGEPISMSELANQLNEVNIYDGEEMRSPIPTPESSNPDVAEPFSRSDGVPDDPRDRQLVSNVSTRVVMENNRRRVVTIYKTIDQIAKDMSEALGGFPRRSKATGPFCIKSTENGSEVWTLFDANDLFALLHDRAVVRWSKGECESKLGDTLSCVTKTEFFKWVKDNIPPAYESISQLPHVPQMPGVYYVPQDLPEPTGEALSEFLGRLNPATEHDRRLMLACLMTPGWGGPPGARPVFVFSSDYGQGSGKTETAKAIGRVWGGASTLDYEDNWQNISKRIMSSDDWLSRVYLFDNVKGKFGGSAIEAAVTSEALTGHKMFVGTVKRPNDATFLITFNLPEMSRDLAQRAIIIKLGRPKPGDFVEWSQEFIRENRMQLISDLLDLLRRAPNGSIDSKNRDRWGAWQRDVLCRVPDSDPNELASAILSRRPVADAEAEEAVEIVDAVSNYLIAEGRREPTHSITEIAASEIVRIMIDSELWTANENYSPSSNARKCLQIVRQKLLGRGVLMPLEVETDSGNRQKKVRVDESGRPTRGRVGKQSVVYGWVWTKASEVSEAIAADAPLPIDPPESSLSRPDDLPI